MKLKLVDVQNMKSPIEKIISQPMSAKTAFKFMTLIEELNKVFERIQKTIQKLGEQYSITDENSFKMLSDDDKLKYNTDFIELMNEEIEVNFDSINIEELKDVSISPIDLINTKKLFVV